MNLRWFRTRNTALWLTLSLAIWAAPALGLMVRSYLMTFHLHASQLQVCFEQRPRTGRRVSVEFMFSSEGRIARARTLQTDAPDMVPVGRCIATIARRWHFDTGLAAGQRQYEFTFVPGATAPTLRSL